jgi:hypothetical protein
MTRYADAMPYFAALLFAILLIIIIAFAQRCHAERLSASPLICHAY